MLDFKMKMPEGKEELKKYNAIKKQWDKTYNKKRKKAKVIQIAITITFISLSIIMCYFSYAALLKDALENNGIKQINQATIMEQVQSKSTKKMISTKTSEYINTCEQIDNLIDIFAKNAQEDFKTYGEIQFKYYQEQVNEIIKAIDDLNNENIDEKSKLKPYETFTKKYYMEEKEFFIAIKEQQGFDTDVYNAIVIWQRKNENPIDKLEALLKENDFMYEITQIDGKKQLKYTYSNEAKD